MQLSKLGEQRLKQSLIDTLHKQIQLLEIAIEHRDVEEIKRIGHSLRGNSGAAYFGLTQVGEIGRFLEQINTPNASEMVAVTNELRRIVNRLVKE